MDQAQAFRQRADELHDAGTLLLESDGFAVDPEKQVQATVGLVSAKMYSGLADLVEYLRMGDKIDEKAQQRKEMMERMAALRLAAAHAQESGNWDEYDRLAGITGAD